MPAQKVEHRGNGNAMVQMMDQHLLKLLRLQILLVYPHQIIHQIVMYIQKLFLIIQLIINILVLLLIS